MSRPGFLASPFFLGFDEMARLLERAAKNSPDAYPPLNIEEPADNILRITLAVAGFTPEHLSVSLSDRELTIKGERPQSPDGRVFLHKGIAARGFMRSFALAPGLEVQGAILRNGLLQVELKRVPRTYEIRQIPITIG
ncbi:MAG: Hsp20 family protein [Alphaproteobacteria bacterium]|nr:Hsp20 family protein [Alphaproteobacteria bacterium]